VVRPHCGQLKKFIKILEFSQALFYLHFKEFFLLFLKKLLTKPPKNAAASRLLNQIVSPAPEKFNYIFRRFL